MRHFILWSLVLLPALAPAETEVLLREQTSWDGGSISCPRGEPEITAIRVNLEKGEETPFHCHPVPTFGYVLSGEIEVMTKSGETVVLTEGQPIIELMNTIHSGKAVNGPVEILVFYAGAAGTKNTLPATDSHCKL